MPKTHDTVPGTPIRSVLTPTQASIGLGLQRYYQLMSVGPTPQRMQMLLDEFLRRAEIDPASAPLQKTVRQNEPSATPERNSR